jgi:hypothetical protein
MTSLRFFRLARRFNTLLPLAIVTIGAAVVAASVAHDLLRGARRHVAAPGAARGEEALEFQAPVAIQGTSVTTVALNGVQVFGGSRGSSSYDAAGTWTRNLLFHDGATGAMRWLRTDDRAAINAWEILREGEVPEAEGYEEDRGRGVRGKAPILGVRYEIADADTNGDGEISPEDGLKVGLSGLAGEGFVTVLRDADEIRGYSAPTGGKLFVFFRRQQKELVAEIDVEARRLVGEVAIPSR